MEYIVYFFNSRDKETGYTKELIVAQLHRLMIGYGRRSYFYFREAELV